MKSGFKLLSIMLCMILSTVGNAQYLNKLIDYDSSFDFGSDLFLINGNPFIFGGVANSDTFLKKLTWLSYSIEGDSIITGKSLLAFPANYNINYGKAKQANDASIVSAFTLIYWQGIPLENRGFAGLIKIDPNSCDTVFTRLYTDTALKFELVEEVTQLPDSSFILSGQQYYKTGAFPSAGLLIKTDKEGNKLWRKTIDAPPSDLGTFIQSIQYIGSDKLLMGAYARDYQSATVEYINRPYFALLDTAGNVLYSRFYSSGYRGGGNIYKDQSGGYYHWGRKDSLVTTNPLNFENNPGYLAHLDDSFNFVWTHVYYDTLQSPYHLSIQNVLQLSDSGYLVMGIWQQIDDIPSVEAYVGKLDKEGILVWEHKFHVDIGTYDCYLVDAVERPDKSLLLVGSAKNAFNPVPWNQDFWLVGLDSNGCIEAGCSPTGVVQLPPKAAEGVKVYPNPTSGALTVSVPEKGKISVVNLQGQSVGAYELQQGDNKIALPALLSPGLYIGRIQLKDGKIETVRISLNR